MRFDLLYHNCRLDCPSGFSDEKDSENYWQSAVDELWGTTNFDTDEMDLRALVNWFDDYRNRLRIEK